MLPKQNSFAFALALLLSGCGLYTPEMYYPSKLTAGMDQYSEAEFESDVIRNVECEISFGLLRAERLKGAERTLPWLKTAGAITTFTFVGEDQSALSPSASFLKALPAAQSFTLGVGASGTANATRTELIQLTFPDKDLYAIALKNQRAGIEGCSKRETGVMIDSDLKIADFIVDKAFIASDLADPKQTAKSSPYLQLQYTVNFVASYSGNITPTWKLTKVGVDSSGTLASATRTNTNTLLMTIGPINSSTQALHTAALTAGTTGQAIQSASH